MPSKAERKSGYLPGLDGLRAFAILGVLMAHDLPWSLAGYSNEKWKGYGGWGVQLFFALSGVLICWRLLEDEAKAGHLPLRGFYIRRLFRIQPAAFCYLAVVAILFLAGSIPVNWHFWCSAVFSYTNFLIRANTPPGAGAFLGHFWTLSVEEHFYLLISLLFLIAKRHRALLLAAVLVTLLLWQTHAEVHRHFDVYVSARRTYWVIQFLLFPALLALLIRAQPVRSLVLRYGKPWVATLLAAAAILAAMAHQGLPFFQEHLRHMSLFYFVTFRPNLLFYGSALWVVTIMLHPASWTTRFLELRAFRLVGRLSYSLYLWHILFFIPAFLPGLVHSQWMVLLSGRPWKYLATALAATLSYYLVERPMIRFGHKVAPPATAGHKDLKVEGDRPKPTFTHAPPLSGVTR